MSKPRILIIVTIIVVAILGAGSWWWLHHRRPPRELVLYGNVDLRQVELAFNGSQRVAEILVEEGDRVAAGQVVARLETQRLDAAAAAAEARAAASRSEVAKLVAGSRPEEIAQARANAEAAKAEAANARRTLDRLVALLPTGTSTQREVDDARAALDVASAQADVRERALELAVAGPRAEDVAQARALLAAAEADLALARRQLADATLTAPAAGVVRSRLLEPGEMATPGTPALSIASSDPKWVRAHVGERELGRLHPGAPAQVTVDSFPGRGFPGWVGFISPVAEFTPRNVETPELRSALTYEVRVFVKDPGDELRQGMPATVAIDASGDAPRRDR